MSTYPYHSVLNLPIAHLTISLNYCSITQSANVLLKLNTTTRELVRYKHNEMGEWRAKCDASIKELRHQFEDTRKKYADITPLHAEYQKDKMLAFVSLIRLKTLEKQLEKQTEKEMLRIKVNNRNRKKKIVYFARAFLDYYKRDRSIPKPMINLTDSCKEPTKAHITNSAAELEELTATRAIPMYKYGNKDWNHISTLAELPRIKWDEMTARMKQTMKGWMPSKSNPSFSKLPSSSNVQNVKRPLMDADNKINIISVKKIKEAATPLVGTPSEVGADPSPSQLIGRFAEPPKVRKTNMAESNNPNVVTSAFFNKPKTPVANVMNRMLFQTNTDMLSQPTDSLKSSSNLLPPTGNIMSPPGNLMPQKGNLIPPTGHLMPPTGNLMSPPGNLMPQKGNLIPPTGHSMQPKGNLMPPTGNLRSPPDNFMPPKGNLMPPTGNLMSPPDNFMPPKGNLMPSTGNLMPETGNLFNMSMESGATPCINSPFNEDQFMMSPSGSIDMEMPSFNVSANYNDVPSFMANTNQPSTDDQSRPMSFFANAGSNPFKMFN